jgi:hypothetical protein
MDSHRRRTCPTIRWRWPSLQRRGQVGGGQPWAVTMANPGRSHQGVEGPLHPVRVAPDLLRSLGHEELATLLAYLKHT